MLPQLLLLATCHAFREESVGGVGYRRFVGDLPRAPGDTREYAALELRNGLRVVLVSDANTTRASAALVVSAGSQDDPPHMLGMAHLAEHLVVTRGGHRRDDEDYMSHITTSGGYMNAYTYYDRTTYWFNVGHYAMQSTLEHFAQLFQQLALEGTEREARVVDSEYHIGRMSMGKRILQVKKAAAVAAHPYARFSMGSVETLVDGPQRQGANITAEVLGFVRTHYSASKMQLVVIGNATIARLLALTVPHFSTIANTGTLPTVSGSPFNHSSLISVRFDQPVRSLMLEFAVGSPPTPLSHATLAYAASLLNSHAPGGLLHELKRKGYGEGVAVDYIGYREFAMFDVRIDVSLLGLREGVAVIDVVLKFIRTIRDSGLAPEKLAAWADVTRPGASPSHHPRESGGIEEVAQDLATKLHWGFPFGDLLTPKAAFAAADPLQLATILDELNATRLTVVVVSQGAGDGPREPWYDTEYTIQALDDGLRSNVTYNFTLPSFEHAGETGRHVAEGGVTMLRNTSNARIWRSHGSLPIANIQTRLCHTDKVAVAFLASAADLALKASKLHFKQHGVTYEVASDGSCLVAWFQGPDAALADAMDRYGKAVAQVRLTDNDFLAIRTYVVIKDSLMHKKEPHVQAIHFTKSAVNYGAWCKNQISQLHTLTLASFLEFHRDFLRRSPLELFVVGDLATDHITALADRFLAELGTSAANLPFDPATSRIRFHGSFVHTVATETPGEPHNAIAYYLHTFETDMARDRTLSRFTRFLVAQAFFHQLRTVESLGYIVYVTNLNTDLGGGLLFTAQSKRHPSHLESRISAFLEQFYATLAQMPPARFRARRDAFRRIFEAPGRTINGTATLHWREIKTNRLNFNQDATIIDELDRLTHRDVVRFFEDRLLPTAPHRAKLSTHVVNTNATVPLDCGTVIQDLPAWKLEHLVSPRDDSEG